MSARLAVRPVARMLAAAASAVLLLAAPRIAAAQGEIIPRPCTPERCPPPPCLVRGECGRPVPARVERVASAVRTELVDRVLRWEVREEFVNRGTMIGEADYLFPLPKGAAFEDLRLMIDGELVSGETLGADEARRIYEEIVRRQRDPALVEYMGAGLLRARIFPIQPGERKQVVVRFQTVAEREGDALRVDYRRPGRPAAGPMGIVGRRVASGDDDRPERRASFTLVLPRRGEIGAPYSPTHALTVSDEGARRTVLVRGEASDVTVLLPVRRGENAAVSMLPYAPDEEDGFALVTLSPPVRRAAPSARDVTFVVDVSGSMQGEKIAQAREAGKQLLATLTPRDRIRLIAFSTDVRVHRDGFVAATPENLRLARHFLEELRAEGSTNFSGALEAALGRDFIEPAGGDEGVRDDGDRPSRDGRLSLVLFVTDGAPTVGVRDPDAIANLAARRRRGARIFTFGVGADVNSALVERLALEGRGTAQFVRPEESVERAVAVVASRLTAPVVTDLSVRAEGVRLVQAMPAGTMDLFAGQDLVLLTRYHGSGAATLVFEGRGSDGPVRWTETVRFPARERRNPFVARLWATQRVGWLSAERRRGGANPEVDDELRALGLRYGIPTELTSYFVREPNMPVPSVAGNVTGTIGSAVGGARRERDGRGAVAVAPQAAPVRSNEAAFQSAKAAAEQRAASSLAAADAAASMADGDASLRKDAGETRRVAERIFSRRDGVWTDSRLTGSERIVKVKPYSDAWFAIVGRLPELRASFALGERVIVVGRRVAIELAPDGAERLDEATLDRLVLDW